MLDRTTLLGLAATAGLLGAVAARCPAAPPAVPGVHPSPLHLDDEKDEKDEKGEEKIAIDQLPAAVVETVKKEVPGGTITEAEKETKKGKTYYSMDVKAGDMAYDLKTKLDGTFVSKEVDEDDAKK